MREVSPVVALPSHIAPATYVPLHRGLSARFSPAAERQTSFFSSVSFRAPGYYVDDASTSDDEDEDISGQITQRNRTTRRQATPSFSVHAPSVSSSDDDEDNGCAVESRRRFLTPPTMHTLERRPSAAAVALADVTTRLGAQLQLRAQLRVCQFQRDLLALEAEERRTIEATSSRLHAETQALAATDAEVEAQRTAERERLLQTLRATQEQAAATAARKAAEADAELQRAALEEARRKQRALEADKQREQAEVAAKSAADTAKRLEQEQQEAATSAAAAAASVAAALENKNESQTTVATTKPASPFALASTPDAILNISPSSAEFHQRCAERLAAAQEAARPFAEDKAMRDVKRSIDKFVTLNVQQISATLEQVRTKAQALAGFIAQHKDAQRTYTLLTLSNKLLSQCEVQITRLHSFAFPLAEVAVAVASAHPDFVELLLGRLHAACPLTVPLYWGFRNGGNESEYLRLSGYKPGDKSATESTDEYVGRMQGYVMFYAALTQSDNPSNPHGLQHAWEYMARLLNALPPTRVTAAALDAFLKVAGYRLTAVYQRQFAKMLESVQRHFLADLSEQADPDARAVYTRLTTYLQTRKFASPPEGRNMPRQDASSFERA